MNNNSQDKKDSLTSQSVTGKKIVRSYGIRASSRLSLRPKKSMVKMKSVKPINLIEGKRSLKSSPAGN